MMHEKACIKYGYDSDEAIRLAYVYSFFCLITRDLLTLFVQLRDVA